jgi:hypothetical protein
VSESPTRRERNSGASSVDELLDRAVSAINRGDQLTAAALAGEVLAVDQDNADAEDLLATLEPTRDECRGLVGRIGNIRKVSEHVPAFGADHVVGIA